MSKVGCNTIIVEESCGSLMLMGYRCLAQTTADIQAQVPRQHAAHAFHRVNQTIARDARCGITCLVVWQGNSLIPDCCHLDKQRALVGGCEQVLRLDHFDGKASLRKASQTSQ